jgi:hypothetical protein
MGRVLRARVQLVGADSSRRRWWSFQARPFFTNAFAALKETVGRGGGATGLAMDLDLSQLG